VSSTRSSPPAAIAGWIPSGYGEFAPEDRAGGSDVGLTKTWADSFPPCCRDTASVSHGGYSRASRRAPRRTFGRCSSAARAGHTRLRTVRSQVHFRLRSAVGDSAPPPPGVEGLERIGPRGPLPTVICARCWSSPITNCHSGPPHAPRLITGTPCAPELRGSLHTRPDRARLMPSFAWRLSRK
jgi:hypothetical protein